MTNRWNKTGHIPSGWGHVQAPGIFMKGFHYFYKKIQTWGSGFHPDGTAQQRKLQASAHRFIKEIGKRSAERVYAEGEAGRVVRMGGIKGGLLGRDVVGDWWLRV